MLVVDSSSHCVGPFTLQKQMSPGSRGMIEFMEEMGACLINARCRRGTWYSHLNSCYYELDYFVGYRGQVFGTRNCDVLPRACRITMQRCVLPSSSPARHRKSRCRSRSKFVAMARKRKREDKQAEKFVTSRQDQGGKFVWICYEAVRRRQLPGEGT